MAGPTRRRVLVGARRRSRAAVRRPDRRPPSPVRRSGRPRAGASRTSSTTVVPVSERTPRSGRRRGRRRPRSAAPGRRCRAGGETAAASLTRSRSRSSCAASGRTAIRYARGAYTTYSSTRPPTSAGRLARHIPAARGADGVVGLVGLGQQRPPVDGADPVVDLQQLAEPRSSVFSRSSRTWSWATTSCTASGTGCATRRSTPSRGSRTP